MKAPVSERCICERAPACTLVHECAGEWLTLMMRFPSCARRAFISAMTLRTFGNPAEASSSDVSLLPPSEFGAASGQLGSADTQHALQGVCF